MKKSNVYTRTGDTGTTSLVSGHRVKKCDPRIEAYGTIDELNSAIGLTIALLPQSANDATNILRFIQHRLFSLGAYLADDRQLESCYISDDDIYRVERAIDTLDESLPPLRQFLLPAGHIGAAQAHVARTIARRAERLIIALNETSPLHPQAIQFVNRISDLLFVIARYANISDNKDEIFWSKEP